MYMKSPSFTVPCAVLVLVVTNALLAGCVASVPAAVSPPNQDGELFSLGAESGKALGSMLSKISDDAARLDIASLATDSATLSSLAGDYYFRIKDLNVSPKYQAMKTNYLMGLLDAETAGDYFLKSAKAAQSEDYTTALTYLEQGNTLFQRSNAYIRTAMEPVPE